MTRLDWFQRRGFLQAAAAWTALGGFAGARAQQRSNIVELAGDAMLNGQQLSREQSIQAGDRVETGPGSNLVFVIGSASFLVRQNSRLTVEGPSSDVVRVLRLLTGAAASVWNKGGYRHIVTPTLTAGIRGTGVYSEVYAEQGGRTYFCNCYGVVDLGAGGENRESDASYHESFWAEPEARNGRWLTPAPAINHTDAEQEMLARLAGERTAWQVTGRKGRPASGGSTGAYQ